MSQNNINIQDLFNTIISFEDNLMRERKNENDEQKVKFDKFQQIRSFIEKELSWNKVSELLLQYLVSLATQG